MKKFVAFFVALLFAFCLFPLPTLVVDAGFSYKTHVTDKSIAKEISLVDWSYSRDIKHAVYQSSGGESYDAVLFGENGTARSYLNAVKRVENLGELGYEDCVDAIFTLALEELADGVRFGISFGLKNYLSTSGTANSSLLYFTKQDGKIYLNLSSFTATADETVILSSLYLSNAKNEKGLTEVAVDISSSGGIAVTVNGIKVYENAEANLATEGYIGFSQTGSAKIYLVSVEIVSLAYDKPTTGVSEGATSSIADFTGDEFNVNEWFCSSVDSYYGGGMYIEDGKLVYDNASETVFSSLYAYSNFSLEVELHDLQREAEIDAAGNVLRPISSFIGFAFGRDLPDANGQSAHNVTQFLYLDPRVEDFTKPAYATSVRFRTGGREDDPILLPSEFNFWNNEVAQDRAICIRICMVDGTLTLELKYEDDAEYTNVFTRYLGYTPLGYVQIWTTGHGPDVTGLPVEQIASTSFKIDNVSLTNKDDEPLTKVVSFETNKLVVPPDFPYVDTWDDSDLLIPNWDGVSAVKNNSPIVWFIIGGAAILIGVATTVFVVMKRGKKQ